MIGAKIKSLREKDRITQKELAEQIGVSQSTIGMIESNKKTGSPSTLKKLSEFFGVSIDFLLSDENDISNLKISRNTQSNITLDIIPEEFTDANQARAYVDKHQIFGAHGFNPDLLDDEEIIKFANELQQQMQMVSFKYRK